MFAGETNPVEKGPGGNFSKKFENMVSDMPDIYQEALRSAVGVIEEGLKQKLQEYIDNGTLSEGDYEGIGEKSIDEIMSDVDVRPKYEDGYIDSDTGAAVFSIEIGKADSHGLCWVVIAIESSSKLSLREF